MMKSDLPDEVRIELLRSLLERVSLRHTYEKDGDPVTTDMIIREMAQVFTPESMASFLQATEYARIAREARAIATTAHKGTYRKFTQEAIPYIDHPAFVAACFAVGTIEKCVAWLHDVVEDTDRTCEDLLEEGMPRVVVDAVEAISRRPEETHADYIERCKKNYYAARVKVEDTRHNLLTLPEGHSLKKRYTKTLKSLAALGAEFVTKQSPAAQALIAKGAEAQDLIPVDELEDFTEGEKEKGDE